MPHDKQTILIIDDQPSTLQALALTLRDTYALLVAGTGQEALDLAKSRVPDLILLDVMLPDISGFDVCRALKADPDLQSIPIIFVTARDETEDEAAGLDIGAIDYIGKPFAPAIVRARVRNHLELKRQRDLLERIAMIDGLTGIANRRHFEQALRKEWRHAQRHGSALAVLLADVDHFKSYNDSYGHQDGDDCLKAVAQTLQQQLHRPHDMLARYGGEEFACLLPATSLDAAQMFAERLCTAITDLALPHRASSCGSVVSISVGLSHCLPCDGLEVSDVLRHADALLYQAKASGRNRAITQAFSPTLQTP